MSKTKMLNSDYDNTLWFYRKPYSQQDVEAVQKFQAAGHRFVVNTGRGHRQILQFYEWFPHPLDFDMVVSDSGAVFKDKNKQIIEEHPIDPKWLRKLMDAFPENIITFTCEGMASVLEESDPGKRYNRSVRYEDFSQIQDKKIHTIILHLPDEEQALKAAEFIREKDWPLEPHVNKNSIDITARGFNKATGLRQAAKYMGVDLADTYAIGDSWNDLDALEAASHAFLMDNASPDLKDWARERNIPVVSSVAEAIGWILKEDE